MKNLYAKVFKNVFTVVVTILISTFAVIGVISAATTIGTDITTTGKIYQTGTGYSVFYGEEAGANDDLTDNKNAAVGYQALYFDTTGAYGSAFGYQALYANTTGVSNSAFGSNALDANTTGGYNNAFGGGALGRNTTGGNNVAFGSSALSFNTTGENNVAIGNSVSTLNTSASSTTAIGNGAAGGGNFFNAGYYTAIGAYSLKSIQTGAENNTAFGFSSGYGVSTGANNILIGYQAADTLTTGSNNIVIGYDIDAPAVSSERILNIGNTIYATNLNGTGTTLATSTVGIGITNPIAKFQVSRGSGGTETLFLVGTTTVNNLLYVGSSGNVGIGTTQPTQKLDVTGNVNVTGNATATADFVVGTETNTATTTLKIKAEGTTGANGSSCLEMKDVEGTTYAIYVNAGAFKFTVGTCK